MPTMRVCAAAMLWIAVQTAAAKVVDRNATIGGTTIFYKVVLPQDYDPAKTYPAVLAFPPGGQTMDMVFSTLQRNWAPEAQRRGYIVVIPAAPDGRIFSQSGAGLFPEFLTHLLAEYKIRDGKFHAAGMSNGGISAFHIAASHPQYFWSVIGFPGYLPDATPERIQALEKMCIYMHVGESDSGWVHRMQDQAAGLRAQGLKVRLTVEKGQGHVISTLMGEGSARLFKEIEEAARGCGK